MMIEKVDVPVTVAVIFDHNKRCLIPKWVRWKEKNHPIVKVGLHHQYREGRVLMHVFSVVGEKIFFRLVLNSETLLWKLEEIGDDDVN